VKVNNIQEKADYIVWLDHDHEGGKAVWQRKSKVAVFARVPGDSIVNTSALSLGRGVIVRSVVIETSSACSNGQRRAPGLQSFFRLCFCRYLKESRLARDPKLFMASSD
jgi:hypothetical protein